MKYLLIAIVLFSSCQQKHVQKISSSMSESEVRKWLYKKYGCDSMGKLPSDGRTYFLRPNTNKIP